MSEAVPREASLAIDSPPRARLRGECSASATAFMVLLAVASAVRGALGFFAAPAAGFFAVGFLLVVAATDFLGLAVDSGAPCEDLSVGRLETGLAAEGFLATVISLGAVHQRHSRGACEMRGRTSR